jgi:hypothetical protein
MLLVVVVSTSGTATALTGGSSTSRFSYLAEETTTSATGSASQTTAPSATTPDVSDLEAHIGQIGLVPPTADQVGLNPGWSIEQMSVRVWPEYDRRAVLVILNLSLPTDAQLPATLRLPIPAGAEIVGIGEITPSGQFQYNYANSYPDVEPGSTWDVASIEVRDYKQLQVDYYYDPGFYAAAGMRSFPLLVQVPMDVGALVLHVQQPATATDFQVEPALQEMGVATDGFNYAVSSYTGVMAGSTFAHIISYNNTNGLLSIEAEAGESDSGQLNTTTVLLAAILVVVVLIGAVVAYRMYSTSRGRKRKKGRPQERRNRGTESTPQGKKQQPPTPRGSKKDLSKAAKSDSGAERADGAAKYCIECGEELPRKSRFCPNCGEARS